MKKIIFLAVMTNLLFAACQCSYQYGVYAKNETDGPITLTYKSKFDQASSQEQVVTIPAGQQKRIIWTTDIKVAEGCTGTTSEHAGYVAEYIYATDNQGRKSHLSWEDPEIEFFVEDIQQGTFTMIFDPEDF